MRIKEVDKWGIHIREYYLYRSDLEKFDTRRLLFILRRLRAFYRRQDWDFYETAPSGQDFENTWTEYEWTDGGSKLCQDRYYAMIWMVKDVLSRREHIPTSKVERKKIRQARAKKRYDRKKSTSLWQSQRAMRNG